MKRFLLPVLLAASLALALLPPNVEADTGSFYLLSEDAIRETDDDVYSPESHLDNPALPIVPGDPLYAPNVFGDEFRAASADGDTWRWDEGNCGDTSDDVRISGIGGDDGQGHVYTNFSGTGYLSEPNGVLVYYHNTTTPARSQRHSSAPVAYVGDFEYRWNFVAGRWTTGTKNLTFALSADPNSWCGLFVPGTDYADGLALSFTFAAPFVFASAYYATGDGANSVVSYCRSPANRTTELVGFGNFFGFEVRFSRVGSTWTVGMGAGAWTCPNGHPGPVYAIADFRTTGTPGGYLALRSAYSDWLLRGRLLTELPPGSWMVGSTANTEWISAPFGSSTSRTRVLTFRLRSPDRFEIADSLDSQWTACTLGLLDAITLVVIREYALCITPTSTENIVRDWTLNIPDDDTGPFRAAITFAGVQDRNATWISYGTFSDTTNPLPPTPTPGGPGSSTPPTWIAQIIGAGYFCGVGVAVFVVFLALMRRVRDS